jgi:hypothetical protein
MTGGDVGGERSEESVNRYSSGVVVVQNAAEGTIETNAMAAA